MISSNDLRPGMKVELDGVPYVVTEYQHHKPGKGGAIVRTKVKNLRTGALVDRNFRPGEKLPLARIDEKKVQFLYRQGAEFHFMDLKTYEQFFLKEDALGVASRFLKEGLEVSLLFHQGEAIGMDLPTFVVLEVVATDPGVKGDTASGGSKPATLESGTVVQVPLFIEVGTRVRVDTRTGGYIERA
ncbi:MAG: elongation factor P [Candidatus Methylomirabilales bacterium]